MHIFTKFKRETIFGGVFFVYIAQQLDSCEKKSYKGRSCPTSSDEFERRQQVAGPISVLRGTTGSSSGAVSVFAAKEKWQLLVNPKKRG